MNYKLKDEIRHAGYLECFIKTYYNNVWFRVKDIEKKPKALN